MANQREDCIDGIAKKTGSSRKQVEATHGILTEKYAGNFALDLERAGLDRLFGSRSIEEKWTDELAELKRAKGGRPGITKDPQDGAPTAEISAEMPAAKPGPAAGPGAVAAPL